MKVDIIIDTICPWCYVGKRRFSEALRLSPQRGLRVGWRAFLLNPGMPPGGMERDRYAIRKFGGIERARAVHEDIRKVARSEGLEIDFGRIARVPNTVDSHRLVWFAAAFGLQPPVVEALFEAHFVRGADIGDVAELARVAARAGIDRDAALEFLESGRERDRILAEDGLARRLGINGVPSFVINRRYAVSGAQAPEVIAKVLELANRDEAAPSGAGGEAA